ncbi:MAG: hypothetical protein HRT44_08860 [Bdellovibrionales bacterium]|nr:hypothetical protein [Bdellovibrionales bacterium]NQZ19351.1 hypothetical protein [Bdellovibrionales bacterium]
MIAEVDFYFPFIVLMYGLVMSIVTHGSYFKKMAYQSFNDEMVQWFYGHRMLGLVCLTIGGLWSFQRVIFLL